MEVPSRFSTSIFFMSLLLLAWPTVSATETFTVGRPQDAVPNIAVDPTTAPDPNLAAERWVTLDRIDFNMANHIQYGNIEYGDMSYGEFQFGKKVDDCKNANFTDQTTDASPWDDDCYQIALNIHDGGQWLLTQDGFRTLVRYKSCALGIKILTTCLITYVGNQDIVWAITESIQRFRRTDGKVGAKGQMTCQCGARSLEGKVEPVEWSLYHT